MNDAAWLVELGSSQPMWFTGRSGMYMPQFSPKADEAIRFARREDAEIAIAYWVNAGTRDGCKATEHMWMELAHAQAPAARLLELGREAVVDRHNANLDETGHHPDALHSDPIETCPHTDCVLFRAQAPAATAPQVTEGGFYIYDTHEGQTVRSKAAAPHGWQPIESAPKDATNVILGWAGKPLVTGGRFEHFVNRAVWTTAHGEYHGSNAPTHFMRLPDPPAAALLIARRRDEDR